MPVSSTWVSAIEFDTALDPPIRAPEPGPVRTSAPAALPVPTGPPSLADLIATVIAVRGAFDAVRAASPSFWTFRTSEPDGLALPPDECRWHELSKSTAWELVNGVRVPFVWYIGTANDVPGLPHLMLALRDLRRIAARCSDADPEQAMFALSVSRLFGRRYAAGPLEVVEGNRDRLPVAYPVEQLEALDAWAETAAKGYTLNDSKRRVLRALLHGALPFSMLAAGLNADDGNLGRWLRALKDDRLVAGGNYEHWKLTPLGRAAIGSG